MRHLKHLRETVKASSFVQNILGLFRRHSASSISTNIGSTSSTTSAPPLITPRVNGDGSIDILVQHGSQAGAENLDPHGHSCRTHAVSRIGSHTRPHTGMSPTASDRSHDRTRADWKKIIKSGGDDGDNISRARASHDLKILAGPSANLILAAHLRATESGRYTDHAGPAFELDPRGSSDLIAS